MNDAEISRKLALAIGWKESDIIDYPGQDYVGIRTRIVAPCVRLFSFKFPNVIWPIAERFNCFPEKYRANRYPGADEILWSARGVVSDTAAKSVALAVIKAHEGSKT